MSAGAGCRKSAGGMHPACGSARSSAVRCVRSVWWRSGSATMWAMRIGVLGPLRLEVDGRRAELGGLVSRRVFAMLVAHAGAVVSLDALVDAVWGADPP